MPKSTAPYKPPLGKKWCVRHNDGDGAFLPIDKFPSKKYSYCRECKRAYQRKWDKENRVRTPKAVLPMVKLSQDEKRILIHLPNDEKGRNVTRQIIAYYPEEDMGF